MILKKISKYDLDLLFGYDVPAYSEQLYIRVRKDGKLFRPDNPIVYKQEGLTGSETIVE